MLGWRLQSLVRRWLTQSRLLARCAAVPHCTEALDVGPGRRGRVEVDGHLIPGD